MAAELPEGLAIEGIWSLKPRMAPMSQSGGHLCGQST